MSTATITDAPRGTRTDPTATNRAEGVALARPSVRRLMIGRVRARIAAGKYVTWHKLDTAAARLLADIAGGSCRPSPS